MIEYYKNVVQNIEVQLTTNKKTPHLDLVNNDFLLVTTEFFKLMVELNIFEEI